MITNELATAQIHFILASDNRQQLRELTRDLQRSRYRYRFVQLSKKNTVVESVTRQINANAGRLPVLLLINYKFAGKNSVKLIELARSTRRFYAIECVVTHPPLLRSVRENFLALGATVFDDQDGLALSELTLN